MTLCRQPRTGRQSDAEPPAPVGVRERVEWGGRGRQVMRMPGEGNAHGGTPRPPASRSSAAPSPPTSTWWASGLSWREGRRVSAAQSRAAVDRVAAKRQDLGAEDFAAYPFLVPECSPTTPRSRRVRHGCGRSATRRRGRNDGRTGGRVMAKRIQRRRERGWRMPEGPCTWEADQVGNPFQAYKCDCCGYWDVRDDNDVSPRQSCLRPPARTSAPTGEPGPPVTKRSSKPSACTPMRPPAGWGWQVTRPDLYAALPSLAGRDLACWCHWRTPRGALFRVTQTCSWKLPAGEDVR